MSRQPVQELIDGHAVIRNKFQITVPPNIAAALDVEVGDTLRFAARSDGTVTVQLLRLYLAPTPLEEAVRNVSPLRSVAAEVEPEPVQW